ncbi:ArsR/SmtB family transcription factor [Flexivirga meconopsidis]|uniref:ArsR/SmtB family transcription factor n=1 Tax=Flexivirga meconopsidis TaxID=2977121 RepID=UPI002240DE1D|nr:metalloregulator ArsR/SmtB family transcription factor [Flexivirga meconopsidis]
MAFDHYLRHPRPFDERPVYDALGEFGKVFANPVRLRLLDVIQQGECTVEDLADRSGIPLKNTSAQLQQLRAAQLVTARRDGVRVYYSIASAAVEQLLRAFTGFAEQHVANVRRAVDDYFATQPHLTPVSAEQLAELGDTVTLVDVRPAEDFARGHIPGAISVPLPVLERRITDIPGHRDVVAYCEGPYCLASPKAAEMLAAQGHSVHTVLGGFTAWSRAGLEVAR